MKDYRKNGAIGALLDEYEKAIKELRSTIQGFTQEEFDKIVDHETSDDDCRSVQTIMTHVLRAGTAYNVYIQNKQGIQLEMPARKPLESIAAYQTGLDNLMKATDKMFVDHPGIKLEEHNPQEKIKTSWGQLFDVEQLMEHAIVHILRHRRQIERFKIKLRS